MKFIIAFFSLLAAVALVTLETFILGYSMSYIWNSLIASGMTNMPVLGWKVFAGVAYIHTILKGDFESGMDKSWFELYKSYVIRFLSIGALMLIVCMIKGGA